MNYVGNFSGNRVLFISIISWMSAQFIKLLIALIMEKRVDIRRLIGSGGMPSSHSAAVSACSVSVGKLYGVSSPVFAVAAVFSFVVMYDAANVRRAAGEHARIINYMMEHWERNSPEAFEKKLKELLGHTPLQVAFGAALGITIGLFA